MAYNVEKLTKLKALKQLAERIQTDTLSPLPFSILREEDIYAPENQKLLFPIMSSSSR